jgi:hypothetical protein
MLLDDATEQSIKFSLLTGLQLKWMTWDMSNHIILLVYVMFTDYCKENIKEEMLCSLELKTYTTSECNFSYRSIQTGVQGWEHSKNNYHYSDW